jgi:5,10-methylenetetrahydromethanopterin reductase
LRLKRPELFTRGVERCAELLGLDDATLDRFAFAGAPADVIRRVEALMDAGVSRVEFGTPHGAADAASGIRLLGRRVLPAFGR